MKSNLFLWVLSGLLLQCNGEENAKLLRLKMMKHECLNMSLSVWQDSEPSTSMIDCFVATRSFGLRSVGVVQRNNRDASCALFRFGQVCQLLSLINISSGSAQSQTEALCEIVVDSEYDAVFANEHFFNAVWVSERGSEMENLVCGSDGQKNPMRSSGVSWTSEGGRMDGVSSRLWVDDPTGLDFTASYTWVLHLKRHPSVSSYLELSSCSGSGDMQDHLQEYSMIPGVSRALFLNPGYNARFQTDSVLPDDPNEFFIAGVSFKRQENLTRFFYGSAFVPTAAVFPQTNFLFNEAGACIKVGWRFDNTCMLRGVIKAVAVSNAALSEKTIAKLFSGF